MIRQQSDSLHPVLQAMQQQLEHLPSDVRVQVLGSAANSYATALVAQAGSEAETELFQHQAGQVLQMVGTYMALSQLSSALPPEMQGIFAAHLRQAIAQQQQIGALHHAQVMGQLHSLHLSAQPQRQEQTRGACQAWFEEHPSWDAPIRRSCVCSPSRASLMSGNGRSGALYNVGSFVGEVLDNMPFGKRR